MMDTSLLHYCGMLPYISMLYSTVLVGACSQNWIVISLSRCRTVLFPHVCNVHLLTVSPVSLCNTNILVTFFFYEEPVELAHIGDMFELLELTYDTLP